MRRKEKIPRPLFRAEIWGKNLRRYHLKIMGMLTGTQRIPQHRMLTHD